MSKRVTTPRQLIEDGDLSGNLTSADMIVKDHDNVSIQLVWTSTPDGEFFVDGSIDGVTFEKLSLQAATTSGESSHLIELHGVAFDRLRIRYVSSSGSGTLQGHVMAKTEGN